ncbi:hypothetical protein AB0I54_44135 [Streptomyces sp. NPDC050625]|uniref:hypothetical protein n=1 Tax=Streptomyces sp. NPDC050625 TaxID=3154629 RepID=UPI003438D40A
MKWIVTHQDPLLKHAYLIFSKVRWVWWADGQAGMGEEGPWGLLVVVDAVDALFGGVGGVGEVVAGEVGEFSALYSPVRRPAGVRGRGTGAHLQPASALGRSKGPGRQPGLRSRRSEQQAPLTWLS